MLVVLVVLAAGVWVDLRDVQHRVVEQGQSMQRVLGRIAQMTTYTTSWRSAGIEYTVSTTCRDGETVVDCLRRHEEAVAAMQELHPPDPPR
jgi:hypothetical protein